MAQIVALLGEPGSFSDTAAGKLFPPDFEPLRCGNFKDIFEAVKNSKADYGVIPVENLIAGSVHENFDLLARYPLYAIREHYQPVELTLLGTAETLEEVSLVLSHPKALEQCNKFFKSHPKLISNFFSDTGSAAKYVSDLKDPKLAAIASPETGRLYGLNVLAPKIQDEAQNFTRFLVIGRKLEHSSQSDKCSLHLLLAHTSGALVKPLMVIAELGFNITKIESLPVKNERFEYRFFIDVSGDFSKLEELQKRIREVTLEAKMYGIYKAANF